MLLAYMDPMGNWAITHALYDIVRHSTILCDIGPYCISACCWSKTKLLPLQPFPDESDYKCAMNVRFCSIVSQLRTLIDLGHVGHALNKFHLLSQHVADLHCKAWNCLTLTWSTCFQPVCVKRLGLIVMYSWERQGEELRMVSNRNNNTRVIDR